MTHERLAEISWANLSAPNEATGELIMEVIRLQNLVCQRDAVISAQESGLAHWRREADRDAGKIARLEKEGEGLRKTARDLADRLGSALQTVSELESKVERDEKKRGEVWRRLNSESLSVLLAAKREWSERTFGPGLQTESIVAHIRKECDEVLAAPADTAEHIDIALLAFDLYWRAGGTDLLADLWAKHRINQARQWRTDGTGPVEHVREEV